MKIIKPRIPFNIPLFSDITKNLNDIRHQFEDNFCHLHIGHFSLSLQLLLLQSLLNFIIVVFQGLILLFILIIFVTKITQVIRHIILININLFAHFKSRQIQFLLKFKLFIFVHCQLFFHPSKHIFLILCLSQVANFSAWLCQLFINLLLLVWYFFDYGPAITSKYYLSIHYFLYLIIFCN